MNNFKYGLFENDFHGGLFIHQCKSLQSALKAIKRREPKGCQGGQCRCGGLSIKYKDGTPLTFEDREELLYLEHHNQ